MPKIDPVKTAGYLMIVVGFILALYYLVYLNVPLTNDVNMAFGVSIGKITEALIRAVYISLLIWAGGTMVSSRSKELKEEG